MSADDNSPPSLSLDGQPSFQMSADLDQITFVMPVRINGKSLKLGYPMKATVVEELIAGLGKARARMKEQRALSLDEFGKIEAIASPAHHVWVDGMSGEPVLSVRHPGFGWLHFSLPKPIATTLGQTLQEKATAVFPPPPAEKN